MNDFGRVSLPLEIMSLSVLASLRLIVYFNRDYIYLNMPFVVKRFDGKPGFLRMSEKLVPNRVLLLKYVI